MTTRHVGRVQVVRLAAAVTEWWQLHITISHGPIWPAPPPCRVDSGRNRQHRRRGGARSEPDAVAPAPCAAAGPGEAGCGPGLPPRRRPPNPSR